MNFTSTLTAFLGLLTASGSAAPEPPAASVSQPNIVLIMADDMGFSDLGCYGSEIETPNLDRLAADGVRFSQFYNSGRCCPTRASLLTGLHPHQAGIGYMQGDIGLPGYRGSINKDTPTIAEVLRPAGYKSYMSGKWHVAAQWKTTEVTGGWPMQRGFDKFYGTIIGAGSFYDPATLCRGNKYITPVNDPEYKPERFHYTDAISDNAVTFLKQHADESPDKPFFLYASYTAPHWPLHAFPEDIAKYKGKYDGGYAPVRKARLERLKQLGLLENVAETAPLVGVWEAQENKEWEARCMEVYAAMITQMDHGIGKILAEIEAQGRTGDTLVLFLQDNGGCAEPFGRKPPAASDLDKEYEPLGRDGLQTKIAPPIQTRDGKLAMTGPGVMPGGEDTFIAYGENWANVSNTPFRLYKHYVHEGGIATPLIAKWPAGIPVSRNGQWNHDPSHLIDIMATCTAISSAKAPKEEGISLVPAFRGEALQRSGPICFEHEGNRAVRDGKWKLVAKGLKGSWELYDISRDRAEMDDLAAANPELVSKMSAEYDSWAARCQVVPFGSWKK